MGAVKSIPLVGEAVTAAEVIVKITAAKVAARFDSNTAKDLERSANDGAIDYTERSVSFNAVASLADRKAYGTRERWKKVGASCLELLDGMPGIGHAKGLLHYALGDKNRGDHCMKAASRTTVVAGVTVTTAGMGAGVATVAAVSSGVGMDVITTGVDSAIHDEFRPSGHVASFTQAIKNSANKAGAIADAVLGVVFETGMTYWGAKQAEKIAKKQSNTTVYRVMEEKEATQAAKTGKLPKGFQAGKGPNGETWISESVQHSKTYISQQQMKLDESNAGVRLKTVECEIAKTDINKVKGDSIAQSGARANSNGVVKNVINSEHLKNHPQGKVNIGIKNANLPEFNEHIRTVKVIDESGWQNKNRVTKAVSRYGKEATTELVCHELGQTSKAIKKREHED